MASQKEIFDVSGPLQLLTSFDWRNTFHRRSVAASLVQGVYNLERDRQRGSIGHEHESHASLWWERFHFQLNCVLVDDSDLLYFGAIYELKYAHPFFYQSSPHPPRYVIAFRGTITTSLEDMKLNLKCILNKHEKSVRFHTAFHAVSSTVTTAGAGNVWLAGHSLGASIAMFAGRNMAKRRFQLETYLFNPPFISVPIDNMIKNQTVKHGVRVIKSLVTAGLATAMKRRSSDPEEDLFVVLAEWTPYVFVNRSDPICAEYIGYFKDRDMMERIGLGKIGRIATQNSFRSLVAGAVGRDSEPLHLLPTAYLTENLSESEDFKQAHGIHQWWQQHFQWQSKLYKFK
ncbi:hypothetical protein L1987_75960 [Smallanthus sonchifolius]|uniref:Uncharacterized protein n=1 Tax=Smallanthus sonchifolius TaxID=185202 RepID=A0ACB9A667_9ASTR|nr:hypothetical protein L1987_75960 [Smallanthus sonchifolius]